MKQYIYYGNDNSAKITSTSEFDVINNTTPIVESEGLVSLNEKLLKASGDAKLAYICNWNQQCGISTYSKFILDELEHKIETKVFSEYPNDLTTANDSDKMKYCWKRGEPLSDLIEELKSYQPTTILIQHEWGIFPNIAYFMSFITELKRLNIPIVIVLHSVYNHLDKLIPVSIMDNIIVHSNAAKDLLKSLNFKGNVFVIPHGCPTVSTKPEIYNIFQTPYLLFGYGFGFKYKGVETAIDAIKILIDNDPKFKNIVYIYACSESENNKGIHANYYDILFNKVKSAGLENNIILLKGFLDDAMLDIYLRTVKMVIFPYVTDPDGVRGSSGAIKIAMSYNIPVIGSASHLFDDVDGYVTRIENARGLATEIDKLFSNSEYRDQSIAKSHEYINNNTWAISTDKYVDVINEINGKS